MLLIFLFFSNILKIRRRCYYRGRMGKIIAIANQKGGVGKTTTAINLSSALAHYDRKILLIDMDPQGNCSKGIGIDPALLKYTVFNALIQDVPFEKIIRKTEDKNIRLIPANLDLAASEARLLSLGLKSGFNYLKYALKDEKNNYDYILVDCPPSLGFLSLNALYAADSVLIPVQCEYFALEAIGQILGTINNIKRSSNPELEILGILLTMYDNRNKLSTEVTRQVLSFFKEKTFATRIPRNINIGEAQALGKPIVTYKPKAAGSIAYLSLAREVISYE